MTHAGSLVSLDWSASAFGSAFEQRKKIYPAMVRQADADNGARPSDQGPAQYGRSANAKPQHGQTLEGSQPKLAAKKSIGEPRVWEVHATTGILRKCLCSRDFAGRL